MHHKMVFAGLAFFLVGFVLIPIISSLFPSGDWTGIILSFAMIIFGIIAMIAGFKGDDSNG